MITALGMGANSDAESDLVPDEGWSQFHPWFGQH
jgi:hypothetical protein